MTVGLKSAMSVAMASLVGLTRAQSSGQPVSLPWNTGAGHGPDGPWNYVTLNMGSNPSSDVDFYPFFGFPQSFVVRADNCTKDASNCIQNPAPNYYNGAAQSAQTSDQSVNASTSPIGGPILGSLNWSGMGYFWTDSVTGDNGAVGGKDLSMYVTASVAQKYGQKSVVPLSLLSMEPSSRSPPDRANPVKTTSGTATQYTVLEQYLNSTGGSSTMSMHMGVAGFKQPGSLVFGGYDQDRLIESPGIFSQLGTVSLTGVSFGTASGLSPWENTPNLPNNFLGNKLDVLISPHQPGIMLPSDVCNFMKQYLPITYDDETQLYLWNTSSPSYNDIVTSPSYMNFTFAANKPLSIRVPFAALNLNLTSPVKDKPTPYFPCVGTNDLNLGRAFLQSAFLFQSWSADASSGKIYIAQAPGPSGTQGSKTSIQQLPQSNPNPDIAANPPKWEDTWSDVLKPLSSAATITPGAASGGDSTAAMSNNGLSGGAIAGIVIGVLAGLALVAGAVVFFLLKKRRAANVAPAADTTAHNEAAVGGAPLGQAPKTDMQNAQGQYGDKSQYPTMPPTPATVVTRSNTLPPYHPPQPQPQPPPQELGPGQISHEIGSGRVYHEMDTQPSGVTYEMADTSRPAEMGSNYYPRR